MDIYVVQPNDSIELIALRYGVSVASIIQYNELTNPYELVPGETIVITYPDKVYTVKDGDTIEGIAKANGITIMQLLRNNPFLSDRDFIHQGETLIISYKTNENITTNAFCYPFISISTLIKTLPFLTYLSIYNYRVIEEGDLFSYYDDKEVIQTAINYGTVPLMMITTLSPQGEPNIEVAFNILMSEQYQDNLVNNILSTIKEKGLYGANIAFNYISSANIEFFSNFITYAADRIRSEGYLFFVTINPKENKTKNGTTFEEIDYTTISQVSDRISFTQFVWGKNMNPPGPVSYTADLRQFIDYEVKLISPNKVRIGTPVVGYDWSLPYLAGRTVAHALSLRDAINLARENSSNIQFDEVSQTPFFQYKEFLIDTEIEHIVWFIDARSINSILELITEYALSGKDIWNVMIFYTQMWLVINSQYNIIKILSDQL
jgi:spore germination protein